MGVKLFAQLLLEWKMKNKIVLKFSSKFGKMLKWNYVFLYDNAQPSLTWLKYTHTHVLLFLMWRFWLGEIADFNGGKRRSVYVLSDVLVACPLPAACLCTAPWLRTSTLTVTSMKLWLSTKPTTWTLWAGLPHCTAGFLGNSESTHFLQFLVNFILLTNILYTNF